MEELRKRARLLRKNQTVAEKKLWFHLRNRRLYGWKFRRQYPVAGYIADFICVEAKLIVEADGSQHQKQAEYDARRTAQLETAGFKVLRFWNNEILKQTELVLEEIMRNLPPHPDPLPGERGKLRSDVTELENDKCHKRSR